MSSFTVPQSVSQNIARAKSLLKRDDSLRALEALINALELYEPAKLMGKARFEAEVLFLECITELNRQPKIRALIASVAKSNKAEIAYSPGREAELRVLLTILAKGLRQTDAAKIQKRNEEREIRKKSLETKGLEYLKQGDLARGKASLRRLADEFGEEPDTLCQIGKWLIEANLQFDAVEFLEQAIELFPKKSQAYALAARTYVDLREFEKAEVIYQKAIKQFGKHTKTLTNLAKMYSAWNKKDLAFDAAASALALDKDNAEAQAIYDKLA